MAEVRDVPTMPDPQPVSDSRRRFGQLKNLAAPDNVDDPLSDTEIVAWEGDSPS